MRTMLSSRGRDAIVVARAEIGRQEVAALRGVNAPVGAHLQQVAAEAACRERRHTGTAV